MYIAVNSVPAHPHVREAFKRAAPDMKQLAGFLGLEIWEAADGSLQAVSRWESKEAMDVYLNHQAFKQHHGGASSAGLAAEITYYNSEVII